MSQWKRGSKWKAEYVLHLLTHLLLYKEEFYVICKIQVIQCNVRTPYIREKDERRAAKTARKKYIQRTRIVTKLGRKDKKRLYTDLANMEKQSINSLYKDLENRVCKISGKLTFEQFQKLHQDFITLSTLIDNADLFSTNETFEDIATSSLIYLLVNYQHGKFIDSYAVSSQLDVSASPLKRNKLRLIVLKIVEGMIWKFLSQVVLDLKVFECIKAQNAGDEDVFKNLEKWIRSYNSLRQEEIEKNGSSGFVKLEQFEKVVFAGSGAVGRRDLKIGKWKLEKSLKEKVKLLEDPDVVDRLDDEVVRAVRIDQILLAVVDSISILENNMMEREMLDNFVNADSLEEVKFDGMKLLETETSDTDLRNNNRKDSRFDKGYTDKLESLGREKPVISKEGKVLRPFTIVGSDKRREELLSKVQGTGQVLPTMTVEELVDYELANGGMVKPEAPKQEIDEDDEKWQDKETYRLREWDEFTDANKKGSGNKMGNLG